MVVVQPAEAVASLANDAMTVPADGGTRLKGIVQYAVDCPMNARFRDVDKWFRASDGNLDTSDEGASIEMKGVGGTAEFEATYIEGEGGGHKIEAAFAETTPGTPPTGTSYDCPPRTGTFTFELSLTRERGN